MVKELMAGKRGLIVGVANERSMAWGIAQACADAGAKLAFTYRDGTLRKRIDPLAEGIGASIMLPCDVTDADSMDAVFSVLEREWGKLDFLVHSIAFSHKSELTGRYIDTTEQNFLETMQVSCYSLTALARRAESMMCDGGSILTLSYYGAEKVVPHYNVMGVAKAALESSVRYLAEDLGKKGIRVNVLSPGPMKTLASSAIGDFRYILKWNEYNSPLRRSVSLREVGTSGLYLLSDMARGVTGEVHYVDSGYHIVGMKAVDTPDITALCD